MDILEHLVVTTQLSLRKIISHFDVAQPRLIASRSLLRRIDSKFLISEPDAANILGEILSAYKIVKAGTERIASYRTLYYDTPNLRCFHDHRRGRRPRHKIRIRHYDDRAVSFLEVKTRRSSMVSTKARQPQPFDQATIGCQGLNFVDENSPLDASKLEPSVRTDFNRIMLVSEQTNERITVDTNLRILLNGRSKKLIGAVIVEVKQSPFSTRTPVMKALRQHGCRPTSASKYCTANILLRPGLRANCFLPALQALKKLTT